MLRPRCCALYKSSHVTCPFSLQLLFLKLFFVTNRDSIAKTLGKRLAQKKMANDLTTWLQACRSRSEEEDIDFEGLEEIKAHIDPTDFIAFNNYERNLRIFSNVVLNTDSEQNPWVVVNTGDRCVHCPMFTAKVYHVSSVLTSLAFDLIPGMRRGSR